MARRTTKPKSETQDQGALDAPESETDELTQEAAEQAAEEVLQGRRSAEEADASTSPRGVGVNAPRKPFPWEGRPPRS